MSALGSAGHDDVAGRELRLRSESEALDAEIERMPQRHAEVERLLDPPVAPAQHAANVAVGVADELGRLILALVLVTAILIALTALSPWFWIAVALWLAYATVTFIWFARRRRPDPSRTIARPRKR